MTLLSQSQVRTALWAIEELRRRRRLVGQPVPPALADLHHHLIMSAHGPAPEVSAPQSKSRPIEAIDAQEAATILGITPRHARRLAADLDAQRIAGRWVFNRHNVIAYAEGRTTP
ncbi:helix-turn-helix domain-containing protein [Gordonia amicalis]